MDIIDTLRKMGGDIEADVPYLNSGGCCVYAAAVARALRTAGYNVWGTVTAASRWYDIDAVRSNLRSDWNTMLDWYNAGASFPHVLVQFEYADSIFVHDSTGTAVVDNATARRFCGGRLTAEELEKLSAQQDGWNTRFDWNDCSRVQDMVNDHIVRYLTAKTQGALVYRGRKQLSSQFQLI